MCVTSALILGRVEVKRKYLKDVQNATVKRM